MKKAIKKIAPKIIGKKPELILLTLKNNNYKVVSFDVFDTLIKRNVPNTSNDTTL